MSARSGKVLLILTLFGLACGQGCQTGSSEQQAASKPAAPATVEFKKIGEETLASIRLTTEARERLAIQTAEARVAAAVRYYTVAGEVVLPPGQSLVVSSPLAGTVTVSPDVLVVGKRVNSSQKLLEIKPLLSVPRDLRTNAEADLRTAETQLETARLRAERADNMLRDRVGSERAREDAMEAVQLAETALAAARARLEQITTSPMEGDVSVQISAPLDGMLRQVNVASGQLVSAGTPLFEVVRLDPVWVRAPIYSGDLKDLHPEMGSIVRPIDAGPVTEGWHAPPISAPPTADPATSTTDVYFELWSRGRNLHLGERVSVSIPMRSNQECLQVPYSSILFDMQGGTWVYEETEALTYSRRRVLVDHVNDQTACLAQGLKAGTLVVSQGGPELFGEEFGVAH